MPVILGVIVLFIYLGMFTHDRFMIEYTCQAACITSVYEEGDIEEAACEYIRANLEKRLICDWDTRVDVHSDKESLEASVEAATALFGKTFIHTAKANKHFCPKY